MGCGCKQQAKKEYQTRYHYGSGGVGTMGDDVNVFVPATSWLVDVVTNRWGRASEKVFNSSLLTTWDWLSAIWALT